MKILLGAVTFGLSLCQYQSDGVGNWNISVFNLKIYFPATASQKVDGEHLMLEGDYIFDDYGVRTFKGLWL